LSIRAASEFVQLMGKKYADLEALAFGVATQTDSLEEAARFAVAARIKRWTSKLAQNLHPGSGLGVGARRPDRHSRTPSPGRGTPEPRGGSPGLPLRVDPREIAVLFLPCLFKIAHVVRDKSD